MCVCVCGSVEGYECVCVCVCVWKCVCVCGSVEGRVARAFVCFSFMFSCTYIHVHKHFSPTATNTFLPPPFAHVQVRLWLLACPRASPPASRSSTQTSSNSFETTLRSECVARKKQSNPRLAQERALALSLTCFPSLAHSHVPV